MASNYTFSKKMSMKGNMEIRTNFGYQKAVVLTYVNGNFYVNLYNNSKSNPGRCSLSYADLEELITIKGIMDTLKPQMIEVSLFYIHVFLSHICTFVYESRWVIIPRLFDLGKSKFNFVLLFMIGSKSVEHTTTTTTTAIQSSTGPAIDATTNTIHGRANTSL